jgi:transcription elongation factor
LFIFFDFRNFTKDDIRVVIHRNNGSVSFVVTDPDTGSTLPVNQIQESISGKFNSIIYGLPYTLEVTTNQRSNAVSVRLPNTQASEVS